MDIYILCRDFNCKDYYVYDENEDSYVCRDSKENCEKFIAERTQNAQNTSNIGYNPYQE